ncbi:putative glycosyltransferase EpsJ [Patescibacteria group bacterium]|jgi:hypothetical protein|nr:glycosyltransferase [Candidatus Dojkabacteria bacterium]CAG1023241.1 putative glycosyltransferase EpsJ [Patescibacteria group bacterium]
MDDKDKRIARLQRELELAKHQLIELNKVKYELEAIRRSRFWRIREVFLAKHLKLSDRVDMLIKAIPIVSNISKFIDQTYLNLTLESVDNTKHEGVLITVVIPYFNYYEFIDDCINSVNNQGLGDKVEIILVEGFSTDGSREKIKKRKWDNTRVIYQGHRTSIGENRLVGIQEAKGRYICMLDADDMLAPDYFKQAVEVLEREHYDVVYPDIKFFEEDDREQIKPDFYYDNIFEFNFLSTPSLFRKSFWEEHNIGYSDSKEIFEDWDFWLRMAKAGARFKHLDGFYHLYRIHTTTVPSMTDLRLKDQVKKDNQTKKPYQSFVHTKEFKQVKQRQKKLFKVINPDINITW